MAHMKKKKREKRKKKAYLEEIAKKQNDNWDGNKRAQLDFASTWPTKLQSAEGAFVDEPVRTTMTEVAAPAD